MNWNRTYRPQKIADLHLAKVRDHFLSLLKSGKLPQVFLFAGPKGTGKTSTARILAALLNDQQNEAAVTSIFFTKTGKPIPLVEPNAADERIKKIIAGASFIVQELDAASNRGIDDVRALKERINLPPQDGRISVYILDEVHMLTTEAFNALLKILEEPPAHVVFILATTELDKIPATVVSRAQVITFTKATPAEIQTALSGILDQEKLTYDAAVLEVIAKRADGSFRDAVKLLEMVAQVGEITMATAEQVLAISSDQLSVQLIEALLAKNPRHVIELFEQLRERSTDQKQFYTQLLTLLHSDLLKAHGVTLGSALWPAKTTQFLLKELSDPFVYTSTPIPLLPLELKFLEIIDRSQKKSAQDPPQSSGGVKISAPANSPAPAKPRRAESAIKSDAVEPLAEEYTHQPEVALAQSSSILTDVILPTTPRSPSPAAPILPSEPGDGTIICDKWVEIVAAAVKQNFGLATLLRSAQPVSGQMGKIIVSVYYSFHKEQLMQPKFKQLLDILFADYAGGRIELECILAEQPGHAELHEPQATGNLAELAVASLM